MLQFNCGDTLNSYITNVSTQLLCTPWKKELSFIVHPQDLASNPGFKCWLQFHSFLRLWENNLTPNGPVLMLTNPAQTLWSITIQLMNSFGACKLTWYYFLLIHWDCKEFTKQSPVSSQEQVLSRHRVTASALPNSPSPVLGKTWNPADSIALPAPSPRHKSGQSRSWSQLQLGIAQNSSPWHKTTDHSIKQVPVLIKYYCLYLPALHCKPKMTLLHPLDSHELCYLGNGNYIS